MPTLESKDGEIFYEHIFSNELAAVRKLMLVNGFMRPHSDFKAFAKRLTEKKIESLMFDNRGVGQTNYNHNAIALSQFVEDIDFISKKLSFEPFSLLGISMGGVICQRFSLEYEVEKLILVSTTSSYKNINRLDIPWSDVEENNEKKLAVYFSAHFLEKNKILVKHMAKQITRSVIDGQFIKGARLQDSAIKDFDSSSWLKNLKAKKVLIVHGEDDAIIPVREAELLHHEIKGSKLITLPQIGHLLLAEAPKEFASIVSDFINS